jgi:hypothetical protein
MSLEPTGFSRRVSRNRCAFIRWKGLFIDTVCDPGNHSSNDSAMWCQHTSKCVGPDGKIVDEFECSPARECYERL